ncbi:hypothetical protein LEP1GSC005_2715 [Leptospira santarosai str. ST188]|nr:hypothetical protein LEP1GSC068_1240 [Leptospira sp. Fiocruz LV3954]EMF92710.1 hypothetical protein LEP1GSC005_2715 [Leptospira santarosai str. ST188]EMI62831.1 hypothetical protein LEP1GSC076_0003 [Leptospira sp. Fiocruz LV4135]
MEKYHPISISIFVRLKTKRGIDSERIRFKNYLIRTTGTSKNREFFENISLPISCPEARTPE